MSQANVEVVRRFYADPRGLSAAAADVLAPGAEFDLSAMYPDMTGSMAVADVREFRDNGPWAGAIHFEPEEFIDVDDERVLVLLRISTTGQGSGASVEIPVAHTFTFRDGRLVQFKAYRDRDDARQATGV